MISGLLKSTLGLKGIAIVAALAFAAGSAAGWSGRDAFCDAAAAHRDAADAKAKADFLQLQVKARDAGAAALATRALADAARQAALELKLNDLESKISDGDCWPDADARRVRELWSRPRK